MRRGLAGLLGLPEDCGQPSLSEHSGEGSSPLLGSAPGQQTCDQAAAAGGLRRHGSGIPLPPPPAVDAGLVRSLSGVPCPPSPTKLPAADGLARQLSGLPLAAALSEAAAQPKPRKRARTTRPAGKQAAAAAAAAATADEERDEDMDEAEQKRQARLMRNRQTAAAFPGELGHRVGPCISNATCTCFACPRVPTRSSPVPLNTCPHPSFRPHPLQAAPPGPHRHPGGTSGTAGGGAGPVRHPGGWVLLKLMHSAATAAQLGCRLLHTYSVASSHLPSTIINSSVQHSLQ